MQAGREGGAPGIEMSNPDKTTDTKARALSAWLAAVVAVLALLAANVAWNDVNQDEGWYLYAARQVRAGRLPFLDFASTQGPVLPFVYACFDPVVRGLGVLGGRVVTALFGLAAIVSGSVLASRLASPGRRSLASFVAFVLVGVNVYQAAFFSSVKTYALCSLFLTCGLAVLIDSARRASRSRLGFFTAGLLLGVAAGTRLSAAGTVPVAALWLLVTGAGRERAVSVGVFVLGAFLAAVGIFGPFAVGAPDALMFGLFQYHAGRSVGGIASVAYKAGFLSRVVHAYFVPACVAVALLAARFFCRRPDVAARSGVSSSAGLWLVWCVIALITAVHFLAPFPYDDYQVFLAPAMAGVLGAGCARFLAAQGVGRRAEGLAGGLVFIFCVAAAFSSPRNQEWFAAPRDRIWWPLRKASALSVLRDTAGTVRSLPQRGEVLLTQDTYLAVEAGMSVPSGLEMGPFCYAPDMPRERAERLHLLNREMMLELLRSAPAEYAAFSGYGLAIRSPEIVPLAAHEYEDLRRALESRYVRTGVVPLFGQAGTELELFRRAGAGVESPHRAGALGRPGAPINP